MRGIAVHTIALLCACAQPWHGRPEDLRAIEAVWDVMDPPCDMPSVYRPSEAKFLRNCKTQPGILAACSYPWIGEIYLAPGYRELDSLGEPVIHEAVHVARYCLDGAIDYGHTLPDWTAVAGDDSPQSKARAIYASDAGM